MSRRAVIITGLAGAGASSVGGVLTLISLHTYTLYTYRGHTAPVSAVAWSPNSQRIASASDDKTVQVWDATTGGHVYTYYVQPQTNPTQINSTNIVVNAVAWSPNGKLIALGSTKGTVEVWRPGS